MVVGVFAPCSSAMRTSATVPPPSLKAVSRVCRSDWSVTLYARLPGEGGWREGGDRHDQWECRLGGGGSAVNYADRQTVSPSIRRSLSRQLIRPSVSVLRGPTLSLSSMRQSYLHRRCTRCCRCPWRGALVAPAAPPPWYCPRFSGVTRITRATCLLGRREREG